MHLSFDPSVVLLLAVVVSTYGRGAARARGERGASRIATRGRMAWFSAAVVVLAVALLPPVDAVAEDLFAVHMVQHVLLSLVAPLLLVLSAPVSVMSHVLPPPTRRYLWRLGDSVARGLGVRRTSPVTGLLAVALHAGVLWLWHVPALYQAAVADGRLHLLEHGTLFAGGALLWWAVTAHRPRQRSGAPVLYLFLAGLQGGALAALLTLAPSPLYTSHLRTTAAWGLTPLEDQQLAGAIMWLPGGLVYLIAAVSVLIRWLQVPAPRPVLVPRTHVGGPA